MNVSASTANGHGQHASQDGAVARALAKLSAALDRLEQAAEARLEREAGLADAETEIQRIGADRSRLAEALDTAEARAQRLESTNREVSRRLVDAMESIRAVLDGGGRGA